MVDAVGIRSNLAQFGSSSKKLNIKVLYDLTISLPDTHPKELKTGTQISTCTLMFMTALFPIAKKVETGQCPSPDKWVNKIWHSHIIIIRILFNHNKE